MTTPLTVVVHGATGTQGQPVVRRLLADQHHVRAVSRHPDAALPAGVEGIAADLMDVASLVAAYRGADAVVVQLPLVFAPDRSVPQAESVLAALAEADVPRAVFNTGGPILPGPVGVPYLDARAILGSKLPDVVGLSTVVGPAGGYMENLSAAWSAPRVAAGQLVYPLPEAVPMPWVALDDLAAVIADALTAAEPPKMQVVAGLQALTGTEAATELSAAIGHPVTWTSISHEEYEQMLASHIGPEAAAGIAGFYAPPPPGAPPIPAPDPSAVRVGETSLREWARRQAWA